LSAVYQLAYEKYTKNALIRTKMHQCCYFFIWHI